MAKSDPFAPKPADKFTFGLWTVGNPGADPFGGPTREKLEPAKIVELLGDVPGVHGVNFHDNDLIPIDATDAEANQIKKDFRKALKRTGLKVPMATTDLFRDPVFKDGAFTSNDAEIRAYAVQKVMRAMELGAEFGAKTYVFWGGREGAESDATKDPVVAIKRMREAIDFLCQYSIDRKFGYRFAFEAKPNEPRGHIYNAVTGSYLAFIQTLKHPEMCGVNPEMAHEHMAGLNFVHQVAAALEAGKLFHIDLNDQEFGRFDQDYRFGSISYKHSFFLVKLLVDYKYDGLKHFDSHAFRQSNYDDVKAFARGSMRTYKILEHKVKQFNKDKDIQKLLRQINRKSKAAEQLVSKYSKSNANALLEREFDRKKLAERPLPYEELDQRVFDLMMGV
ncbi:xylose isomerase [Phycisphaerales bacterium AB-hyl4]|uniref:Xylose isomerase n=1 Tax=Natronomicrosphaera hydrolytica TaxID=3242702 RepID=A0ABV4U419_9BACT